MMMEKRNIEDKKENRAGRLLTDVLREKNLDWLFFKSVYMHPIRRRRGNRLWGYGKLGIQIIRSFFIKKPRNHFQGGLFYIDNSRHHDQAKRILPFVDGALYHNNSKEGLDGGKEIRISSNIHSSFHKLLKYIPYFISEEFHGKSRIFKYDLTKSFYGILLYEHFLDFFRRSEIKYVVIFTDHSFKNRALLFAAKESGVETIYIPHASVSMNFPPLEFDSAFLEGEDMKDKYQQIAESWKVNSVTSVYISGNIKINYSRNQKSKNQKQRTNKKILGLAFNKLDFTLHVKNVVNEILSDKNFEDYEVRLRPHPGIKEEIDISHPRVSISNAVDEDVADFLTHVTCLISGDSNIVLDAALLQVPVFILDISKGTFKDVYDFVKNGVSPQIDSVKALHPFVANYFNEYNFNEQTLSHYDWSFGKDFDSVRYVSGYLNSLNS